MGFIPPQIERHGLSGLYLTALLTAIAAVLAVTGAGSVLVFVVNAIVKHIAIRDQSICILDATLRIVPGFAVLFMFSACGVFLSLFFITVVGSLFGIIDLFLVALVLSMWRGNPHRWEYGRDDMFDIDSVYVFFIHTMATCLWPIHLFRLIGMPSWSPSFEALATSFINTYSHYIQTAYFTTLDYAFEPDPTCASPIILAWQKMFFCASANFMPTGCLCTTVFDSETIPLCDVLAGVFRVLFVGVLFFQAQYVGKMVDQGRTALFSTGAAETVMPLIEKMRSGVSIPGNHLDKEVLQGLDGALLGFALGGVFLSRFRYMALLLFDDGINRLQEWGYGGWIPWLLSYGVHGWVVFTDLRCYMLLARMVTRLAGATLVEFEGCLHCILEWLLMKYGVETEAAAALFAKGVDCVCCWYRALDSWLEWVWGISEGEYLVKVESFLFERISFIIPVA